jgi:hypothetical protein
LATIRLSRENELGQFLHFSVRYRSARMTSAARLAGRDRERIAFAFFIAEPIF